MPSFAQPPEAWQLLRETELAPKNDEDNYDMSDREEGTEEIVESDRNKRVPAWALNYMDVLTSQGDLDPDTIFGSRVPDCNLDLIFSDDLYRKCTMNRPKRKRGSSCQWSGDSLKVEEMVKYKEKMGQKASWMSKRQKPSTTTS